MPGMEFVGKSYRLSFPEDRPFVYLETNKGTRIAELFMLSSVHTLQGRDDTVRVGIWEKRQESKATIFTLHADSSIWRGKTYRLSCFEDRLEYDIEVEGEGLLAEVNYFGGYFSGNLRWGSGYFHSGQAFKKGFNPEPSTNENYHFPPDGGSGINLTGVPLPGKADWFYTPPPFCFAFLAPGGWVGIGVQAAPGQNRFTEVAYQGSAGAFHLSLSYEGHTRVQGKRRLPSIGFVFADDPYAAIEAHVAALQATGCVPAKRKSEQSDWWRTPIFCGWGAQCYLASKKEGRAPDFARQENYEGFLRVLSENGVQPGIVVLDDKWQKTYGENQVDEQKWPDLPGFVAQQHASGRKVLLWIKAWDAEGLPVEECVTNAAGMPVTFDPTNSQFERRLRLAVRRMLSPEGYNADGFKIDFTARIPSGPGFHLAGDAWGLELMRAYLEILYTEAKSVKRDALIMSHTPHPYLCDVLDMIRLNDINIDRLVNPAMIHRAGVAAAACPGALIDTDNWPMPNKIAWRNYLAVQSDLGVPSLYYATHIDSTGEALDESDYALIRETWKRYLAGTEETQ